MSLKTDAFDVCRQSAACGTSMRPTGRPYVSDVGAATNLRHLRSGIPSASGTSIRYSLPCRERVAGHPEDVVSHGMAHRPSAWYLVPSGRAEAQGVSSIRRGKQRST